MTKGAREDRGGDTEPDGDLEFKDEHSQQRLPLLDCTPADNLH